MKKINFSWPRFILLAGVSISSCTVGINYLFALMGEPRSLWLMQLLGIM